MDKRRQDAQLEPTHSSFVLIQDVALKTCQKQWMIEKESGISVLMARHEDNDIFSLVDLVLNQYVVILLIKLAIIC